MALVSQYSSNAADAKLEEDDDLRRVFRLISNRGASTISEAALAQALKATQTLPHEEDCRRLAAETCRDGKTEVTVDDFGDALRAACDEYNKNKSRGPAKGSMLGMTIGAALLGVLEDLKKFYAEQRQDFTFAASCEREHESLDRREVARRVGKLAERQESEHQGVQEAQMMQAMEFNSAWSQNMTEFERQARDIEEGTIRKFQDEFAQYQEQLRQAEPRRYRYSSGLKQLIEQQAKYAKMKRYQDAEAMKPQIQRQKDIEHMEQDNKYNQDIAQKELRFRQVQQQKLEALRARIQRGREEHKEHWLMGAQRLMQSHRNMLSDLKSKQAIENQRADVAVKLEMNAARSEKLRQSIKNGYTNTLPRVDCGKSVHGSSRRKLLG